MAAASTLSLLEWPGPRSASAMYGARNPRSAVPMAITIIMCVTESFEVTSAYKDPPVQWQRYICMLSVNSPLRTV